MIWRASVLIPNSYLKGKSYHEIPWCQTRHWKKSTNYERDDSSMMHISCLDIQELPTSLNPTFTRDNLHLHYPVIFINQETQTMDVNVVGLRTTYIHLWKIVSLIETSPTISWVLFLIPRKTINKTLTTTSSFGVGVVQVFFACFSLP